VIEGAGFGSASSVVPLSFDHIGALGSISFSGAGDILLVNGTNNSDTFNVTGTTVQIFNTTSGFASVLLNLANVFNLELRGLDGSDTFNVNSAVTAINGGVIFDGGNSDGGDTLNLTGPTGAVSVTLGTDATVSGYGSPVTLLGLERLNVDANLNNATFTASSGDDTVDVTPTGTNAVTFSLASSSPGVGATPVVNFTSVGTTMSVAGGSGNNELVFHGSAGGEFFDLSRNSGALSLSIQGKQAISPTNTFSSWRVAGGAGTDTFTVVESGAIAPVELNIEGGSGANNLLFSTAFTTFFTPLGGFNGKIDGGAALNFTDMATTTVTLAATVSNLVIRGNGAANQITLTGTNSTTIQAQVDDSTLMTFNGSVPVIAVEAGAGDDTIVVAPGAFNGAGGITVNGGSPSSNDRLVIAGTSADDKFSFIGSTATDGTVSIAGAAFVTYSNTRKVILDGLDGPDRFFLASARGSVEVIGGEDVDVVDFSGAASSVVVDLDLLGVAQRVNSTGQLVQFGDAIENFTGTSFNDTLSVKAGNFARTLDGGGQTSSVPGDTLIFSGAGAVVNIQPTGSNSGVVRTVGLVNVSYDEFETRTIVNSPSGPANFGSPGTSDAFSAAHIYDPTLFVSGNKPAPGKGPTAVAAGDLNGDGFADMVLVNSKSANISILLNLGNGTFSEPVNLPTVLTGPQDLVLGDFDADGFVDAVVTFPKAGKFAFLKGDGVGSFAAPVATTTAKFKPFGIAAADLDGDTDMDLAVTSRDTGTIAIMLGDGAGSFAIGTPVKTLGSQPVDIAIGDFNGDGSVDLATANAGSNNINLFRGDGLGAVAAPVRFTTGVRPTALAVGDLDNDGDLDLAVSNAGSRFVSILLGKGNVAPAAQFASQLRAALTGAHQASAIAVGDFDGDGIADLGIGNGVGTKFTVLRGTGGAIFSQPYDYDLGKDTKPNPTSAIALADLNNDGLLDVIAASIASNDVRTLLRKV
jgi:hypothetical protein